MSREEQIKWLRRLLIAREDPRGDTKIDVALKCAIKTLEQEPSYNSIKTELKPSDDWVDVPSDEMTLEQARAAVKDLRKALAMEKRGI